MSFINIINESFDRQNKKILVESKLTQLRKAFGEAGDNYDIEELLGNIFPQFARKAYKIVKNHGYTGVFSEIDTQGDLGDDFFYANKDSKSYIGNYNYQQELDDITEIVLFGKATTYKELIDELAEWYANLILSKLEFDSDDEWDESEWGISESYTKSSKAEVAKNKSLREYFDYGEAEDLDELDDMLDQSGSLIYEAAEKLGLKDFEWEDSVQGAMGMSEFWITDEYGDRLYASVDFSETWVTDIDEAIMLLDNLEWEVVDDRDEDLDEDLDTQSKNDLDFNEDDSSDSLRAKIEKLKNLDRIPDFFFMNSPITSVVIPSNIKSIGDFAFADCRDLKTITIPDSVTDIGRSAFEACGGLTSITIPNNVTDIGSHAFAGCRGLTSITIPDSVTWIEGGTFNGCSGLKSIRIPDMAEVIGGIVFAGCRDLTSVTIPSSVSIISDRVFAYCEKLKEITYKGTKADWNKIKKQPAWNYYSSIETIHCTDGDIEIKKM